MPTGNSILRANGGLQYSQNHVAQSLWVGVAGIMIPLFMLAIVKLDAACHHTSISHFYYSKYGGTFFVAALVFIGSVLLFYRSNKQEYWIETWAANGAGFLALVVAFVPTKGGGCVDEGTYPLRVFAEGSSGPNSTGSGITAVATDAISAFNESDILQGIHFGAAALMLIFLAFYATRVFTRVDPDQRDEDGKLTLVKRARNAIYYLSGLTILLCIAIIGIHVVTEEKGSAAHQLWNAEHRTFWYEAVALWAFSFAWLVKGRFLPFLQDK